MPFPYIGETEQLNETTRSLADGSFVRLPLGVTHYELAGPGNGPRVVLAHGFSVPYFIFDPTFEFLVSAGCRVLRFDLYGRGWSDRPRLPNDIDLFVQQLQDLLDALNFASPVILAGLSMGGPISAAFTVAHPDRVAANVLIDPCGTHPIQLGLLQLGKVPPVGELGLGLFGSERLVKNIAADFFDPALIKGFQERYRTQMRFAGFNRSILSTLRHDMLGSFADTYRCLGQLAKPALILWGRQDSTVPFAHSVDLLQLIPQARFQPIEDCGHIPHYEKPAEVNPILLDFIQNLASGTSSRSGDSRRS